jgi:gas vesicle protein
MLNYVGKLPGAQFLGRIHEEVSMQRTNTTDYVASFLVGGLVGAGVALLFAPQSGSELRGLIGEKVREGGDRGRVLKERVVERSRELVDDARQGLQWQKERLAAAVEAGRDTYREEKAQS